MASDVEATGRKARLDAEKIRNRRVRIGRARMGRGVEGREGHARGWVGGKLIAVLKNRLCTGRPSSVGEAGATTMHRGRPLSLVRLNVNVERHNSTHEHQFGPPCIHE